MKEIHNSMRNILAWVLLAVGVIFALWYAFGNSPTIEQGLLFVLLGIVLKDSGETKVLSWKLSEISKKFEEHLRSHS
ncbi:MAG: hypothetical protein AABX75_03285 [Nanoarchaeota archaeon]